MEKNDIIQVKENLTNKLKEYIPIIIKEYGKYMPIENLEKLKNISDYSSILQILDCGTINAFVNNDSIVMPLCANKVLDLASKIPGYGINKSHKTYNDDNMIINNNTFFTYVLHVFISGTNAEGYYDDLLLHETMHFCGSGGSDVIKEGITELLTRILAKKYNLRVNSCGYPKEIRLSYKLFEMFGEEAIYNLAFLNSLHEQIDYIISNIGSDAAVLYLKIYELANSEFHEKYYSHMKEFNGIFGIIKKMDKYNKIDYSKVYSIIDDYEHTKVNNNHRK